MPPPPFIMPKPTPGPPLEPTDANPLPGLLKWALQGQARHWMTTLGGALMAHGFFPNQAAADAFTQWGVSGLLILGGMAWSFLDKAEKKSDAAT